LLQKAAEKKIKEKIQKSLYESEINKNINNTNQIFIDIKNKLPGIIDNISKLVEKNN